MAAAHRQDMRCSDIVGMASVTIAVSVQGESLMWYAIYAVDNDGSLERRLAARPAHVARLTQLRDAGRLLLAGPFPAIDAEDPGPAGFSGSLIVAEFADLVAAKDWADADPYIAAGVYCDVSVRPFRKTLP
jgi:uncharacterized protein